MAHLGHPPGPGGPFSRMGPHQGEDPTRDKAMRSIFGELEVPSWEPCRHAVTSLSVQWPILHLKRRKSSWGACFQKLGRLLASSVLTYLI